jgi:hypothetical protein
METQFDYWGIKNYHRVSGSKYLASEFDKWKPLISNEKEYDVNVVNLANFITHIEMIKNWLETTNDEYMIMMEDDYDLSLIEYWNFDWEYLMMVDDFQMIKQVNYKKETNKNKFNYSYD